MTQQSGGCESENGMTEDASVLRVVAVANSQANNVVREVTRSGIEM